MKKKKIDIEELRACKQRVRDSSKKTTERKIAKRALKRIRKANQKVRHENMMQSISNKKPTFRPTPPQLFPKLLVAHCTLQNCILNK